MTIDTSRFKIPDRKETKSYKPELPFKVFQASRQDRIAQLMQLLNDAIAQGNDDLAQEVRSDLFREYGLQFNKGGMMDINHMTRPVGYRHGTRGGDLVGDAEKDKIALAYKLAQAQNPDGRISEKDFQLALKQVNASSADPASVKNLADILNPDGRITDTDRKFSQELTGVPERENVDTTAMRSMLESWMYKNPDQRISDSDIANMAIGLARDMAGGSSNENVNMAIDRLNALLPSVKEKVRVENTDLFTRGMQGLYSLLRPSKNRGVGFERVR
jgi:hypothetical protein